MILSVLSTIDVLSIIINAK